MGDLTKNFSRWEFACKCGCGADHISLVLVEKLQNIRDDLSRVHGENDPRARMDITSGVRCKHHNAVVGGEVDSEHLYGEAADVEVDSSQKRFELVGRGYCWGFLRIGPEIRFVHFGVSKTKPQEVMWLY